MHFQFIFTNCMMSHFNFTMVLFQHCVVYLHKFLTLDTMHLKTSKSSTQTKWSSTIAFKATIHTAMLLRNVCFLMALRSGTDQILNAFVSTYFLFVLFTQGNYSYNYRKVTITPQITKQCDDTYLDRDKFVTQV